MALYLVFLFPKNLEAHITMALAQYLTPVLTIIDFGDYTQPSFPDQNTTHHSSWPSSQILS